MQKFFRFSKKGLTQNYSVSSDTLLATRAWQAYLSIFVAHWPGRRAEIYDKNISKCDFVCDCNFPIPLFWLRNQSALWPWKFYFIQLTYFSKTSIIWVNMENFEYQNLKILFGHGHCNFLSFRLVCLSLIISLWLLFVCTAFVIFPELMIKFPINVLDFTLLWWWKVTRKVYICFLNCVQGVRAF